MIKEDAINILESFKKIFMFNEDSIDTINLSIKALKLLPKAGCANCKYGRYNNEWDAYYCIRHNKCLNYDHWEEDRSVGEWVIGGKNGHFDILECSECGHREFNHYNYCPECGCRMVNGKSRNKCGKIL